MVRHTLKLSSICMQAEGSAQFTEFMFIKTDMEIVYRSKAPTKNIHKTKKIKTSLQVACRFKLVQQFSFGNACN